MKKVQRLLLTVDGAVNLLLGGVLLAYPGGFIDLLGLPFTDTLFYPSILGAVLFGIGMALVLEVYRFRDEVHGLGVVGAIAINLIASIVLFGWLVSGSLEMPLRGRIILWCVDGVVFGIGILEIITQWRNSRG